MYQGYSLIINGNTLPENYIVMKSYSLDKQSRVADSYEDADLVKHEITFGSTKVTIAFSLRQHFASEHSNFTQFTGLRDNVPVTYYDDNLDDYVSGIFKIPSVNYSHYTQNGQMLYSPTEITLEEY